MKLRLKPGAWVAPAKLGNLVVRTDDWRDGWIHQQMQIAVTPADAPNTRDLCALVAAAPDMYLALRIALTSLSRAAVVDRVAVAVVESALSQAAGGCNAIVYRSDEDGIR